MRERDDFSSNRHPALSFCLSMISAQTPSVCREGKPVPTFPDHALNFAFAEQRRELLLAVAAEVDDAAARGGITRGPFQFGESRHHGRPERAGEMMAPLAPVKASLAHRAARMGERFSRYLQGIRQETPAFSGELDRLLALADQPLLFHAVEHLHAEIARQMIVANPGATQRRLLRPGAAAPLTGA